MKNTIQIKNNLPLHGWLRGTALLGLFILVVSSSGCSSIDRLLGDGGTEGGPLNILVIGQSNGVSPNNAHSPHFSGYGAVETTVITNRGEQFVPTQENPDHSNISWIYLGDHIYTTSQREVRIYNRARGNTNSVKMRDLYLGDILTAIREKSPHIIIWIQGESDEIDKLSCDESEQAYQDIFKSISNIFDPKRVFVALDGFIIPEESREQSCVRQAQRMVIKDGLAQEGVDIDEMRDLNPSYFESGFGMGKKAGPEFAGAGLMAHGEAWFHKLTELGVL